ncbi:MAG: 30S ribosomal protein S17 [Dehalococcoidia bacterium]
MTAGKRLYGGRKTKEGTVVSDKMENTVVVAVKTSRRHPLYKKTIRRVHKFMAHDASGDTKLGDLVRIVEISPVSKRKRWGVVEVLERAELPDLAPGSIDLEIIGEVKAEAPVEEAPATAIVEEPTPEGAVVEAESAPEAVEEEPPIEVSEEPATEAAAETEPEAPEIEEAVILAEPVEEESAEVETSIEASTEPATEAAIETETEAAAPEIEEAAVVLESVEADTADEEAAPEATEEEAAK